MYLPEEFATTAARRQPRGVRPPAVTVYASRPLVCFFEPSDIVTLVADLALGAIRPNAIAAQLCQQLGVALPVLRGATHLAASALPQTADIIGALIDRETYGFAPVLAAHAHVEAVLGAMIASGRHYRVVLVPPHDGSDIGEDNQYFLQFLAEQSTTVELCIVGRNRLRLSPAWIVIEGTTAEAEPKESTSPVCLAAHFPGILNGEQAERCSSGDPAAAGLIALPNQMWAVPPSFRSSIVRGSLAEREQITPLLEAADSWLRAYAIVRLQLRVQVSAVIGFGWRAVAEGGHRVALSLFEAAKSMTADPLTSAQLDSMIWGTRIGVEEYAIVADLPVPDPALPPRLRVQLLQHKAWGLTMSGRLEEAQKLFEEACALLADPEGLPTREYLYLLNITAFTHFRRGQLREAFQLEHQISDGIARLAKPDQHLAYVNSLNLGRIHLRQKNPEQAQVHFERANATHNGLRTLADRLSMHIYRARTADLRRNEEEAKRHWLRAALAWISDPLPECLSARAARLILGQQPLPRHLWFAAVNGFFAQRLRERFGPRRCEVGNIPTICPSHCLATPNAAEVIGLSSGAVVITAERLEAPQDHPSHRTLRALVRDILVEESNGAELAAAGTIYIDDQSGTEPACTRDEAITLALRLGVPRVRIGGRIVFDHDCGDDDHVTWSACLSPSVASVTTNAAQQTTVAFRRYRAPRMLELTEAPLVLALVKGERDFAALAADTGWSHGEIMLLFRRFEQERIVIVRAKTTPVHATTAAETGATTGGAKVVMPPETAERLFQEIYTQHITIVWKTVHAFTNNKEDQEDLFQEILIALWEALPHFEARSKLTTYVYRVAHRRALNWKRSQRRYQNKLSHYEHDWPELTIMSPDPADQARLEWLYRSINTLKPIDRTICLLYLDGVSYSEMAEILGITQDNIGIRVHRCKRQLTELLERSNEESLRRSTAVGANRRPANWHAPAGLAVAAAASRS